jgi:predicted permease
MLQLTGLSIIVALILGKLIAASRWAVLLRIIAVVAALTFLLIFMGYVHRADQLDAPSVHARGAAPLARFAPLSVFFPTSWLMRLLPHTDSAIWTRLLYGTGFAVVTIGCPAAAFHLFRRRFRQLWAMTMEVKRRGRQKPVTRHASRVTGTMGNTRTVMLKEARVMWREPHMWIGLTMPLVLFPLFIFFMKAEALSTQVVYIIVVSLLTTTSYSLSCIGREGRSFPLLRSLPMRMSVVLRAKFSLGCAVNLTVTLAFVIALYLARRLYLNQMWLSVLIAVITSVYFSAFGTALAALFPKFDFTNPMRAASLPGLLMLYLMAFLFGITFVGTITAGWYFTPLVMIPWAGIALMLMRAGQERLERIDI